MRRLLPIIIMLTIFLVSGCLNATDDSEQASSTDPQKRCIEVCRDQIAAGVDLHLGPCLSESMDVEWDVDDWACDVAHQPREMADDTSLNQCQDYRKELVKHFVEVSPNCEFIRKQ
jgi:hypothetical protein